MARIRGISVTLYTEVIDSYDGFGNPIFTYTPKTVDNVLVAEPSSDDVTSSLSMYGKKIAYVLGIPKGNTDDWVDKKVEWKDAYGNVFTVKTFGYPITGIEANVPGQWHMKVKCEAYG